MLEPLSQERPFTCVSDLRLDAYLAEESTLDEARSIRGHLAHCERCRARLAALMSARTQYLASPPGVALRSDLGTRAGGSRTAKRGPSRTLGAFAVLAAAAALLLTALPREASEHFGETRLKGGQRLGFFVKHKGRTRRGSDGERVSPGDLLRFTYTTTRAVQLAVLSYDAEQHASAYVPFIAVAPGVNLAAPLSVELDASLGVEQLYGMFCAERPVLSELLRMLEVHAGSVPAVPGCEVVTLKIEKVSGD